MSLEGIFVYLSGNWMDLDETWLRDGVKKGHYKIFGEITPGASEKGTKTEVFLWKIPHISLVSALLISTKLGQNTCRESWSRTANLEVVLAIAERHRYQLVLVLVLELVSR